MQSIAMAQNVLFYGIVMILSYVAIVEATILLTNDVINKPLNRNSFPEGFIFGTASSAYQYEGAANVGGRGPSIWDAFTHNYPGKIEDRSNGDVAIDEYHRYKEDVELMKDINMDAYRFSISWSRILPKGRLDGGVNKEGIKYYNNLINELLAKGLQPFVTLFHWDLPQTLEEEYSGFLSPNIVNDFRDYAELCFKLFGDRVKHWITLNEPWSFAKHAYAEGIFAPGRCSPWLNLNCTGGDSATEPYIVAHNQLLAHALAVNVYKTKYQASQKGKIGITLVSDWVMPLYDTELDHQAAQRAMDFIFGWFMDPLTFGDYPSSMRSLVGSRLPKFSTYQAKLVRGSFDFIGVNYYTSTYATNAPELSDAMPSYTTDPLVILTQERNGIPIGPTAASFWMAIYPKGIRELLLYTKTKYNNPLIYITENGMDELDDPTLSLEKALEDKIRVDYYYNHLYYLQTAIEDGVNVKGYFAWSLIDNFEWSSGYTMRFGLYFVDYNNGIKRYPKMSAIWFKNFLQHKIVKYSDSC
ncbi:Beta-glucosidase 12 [Trifolium repens]|nr:Beta-glucosidase 12 [Trifolium repens]